MRNVSVQYFSSIFQFNISVQYFSSIFGYTSCLKDGIINVCGSEYRDLLDTAYNDIVAGVFGDSFGCDIIPFVPVLGKYYGVTPINCPY